MGASVEYKGYVISFSENSEEWGCYDVGYSHTSLGAVKRRIDSLHRKIRKDNAVPCLVMSSYRNALFVDGTIVEYLEPIRARSNAFERVPSGEVIDHSIAAMSAQRRGGRQAREKLKLSEAYAPTPENLEAIECAQQHIARAKVEENKAREVLKGLECITLDQIAPIIEASEHRFVEGD